MESRLQMRYDAARRSGARKHVGRSEELRDAWTLICASLRDSADLVIAEDELAAAVRYGPQSVGIALAYGRLRVYGSRQSGENRYFDRADWRPAVEYFTQWVSRARDAQHAAQL